MSIAFIDWKLAYAISNAQTANGDTSLADLLVVAVSSNSLGTLSDAYSNTWIPLTSYFIVESYIRLYYCFPGTKVGSAHWFKTTGLYAVIMAAWFSGTKQGGYTIQEIGSASKKPGSITPDDDNSLLVTGATSYYGSAPAVDSGFATSLSKSYSPTAGGGFSYQIQTTKTPRDITWTTGNNFVATSIAVFKPASNLVFPRSRNLRSGSRSPTF